MKLLQVIAVTTAAFGRVSATHPSTSPTASPCPQCLGDLEITATASGYMDGNSASVAISYEGSYSFAYDDTCKTEKPRKTFQVPSSRRVASKQLRLTPLMISRDGPRIQRHRFLGGHA